MDQFIDQLRHAAPRLNDFVIVHWSVFDGPREAHLTGRVRRSSPNDSRSQGASVSRQCINVQPIPRKSATLCSAEMIPSQVSSARTSIKTSPEGVSNDTVSRSLLTSMDYSGTIRLCCMIRIINFMGGEHLR